MLPFGFKLFPLSCLKNDKKGRPVLVHKFYTDSPLRNYNYLFDLNEDDVAAIDPLFPEQIESWCQSNKKTLKVILVTHEHPDHIHGLKELATKFDTEVWAHPLMKAHIGHLDRELNEGDEIEVHGGSLRILHTPGHTPTHICLLFNQIINEKKKQAELVAMDTVFNAGVGHCKLGGDPKILYKTIVRLGSELEDQVILHPGHDYIEKNLSFTLTVEPDNTRAREVLAEVEKVGSLNFVTTIGLEKEINTFFRLDSKSIRENLPNSVESEEDVFINLRKLRDNF